MLKINYSGTPEHYMKTAGIRDYGDIDIDALTRALDRAEALCILLEGEFDREEEQLERSILLNAVNAISAFIGQAQILTTSARLMPTK